MEASSENINRERRSANFTIDEEQLLVSLVEKYKNIVECKKSNSVTWREKEKAWQNICQEFNSSSGRCPRSLKNLKEKFNNIKKRTKQRYAEDKKNILKTGGGHFSLPPENEIEVVVKGILGEQLTGLLNKYDDDRDQARGEMSTSEEGAIDIIQEVEDPSRCTRKEDEENSHPELECTNSNRDETDNWQSYSSKNLKRIPSEKLRNIRKFKKISTTKKICAPSQTLIEEKLELVRLQKEKFLEEHNLKMDILRKKQMLINAKLAKHNIC